MEAVVRARAAEVVAFADPNPEALEAASRLVPDAQAMTSIDALLDLNLHGLVIATPSALHAPQAITALERGMAVFCQKPLARTAAETRAVVEAAGRANRPLGVDFSYRHTKAMRCIRELRHSGELGQVYGAKLVFHNAYGPDKPWFYERSLSGGGCVMDLGIHLVDLALWVLDFPAVEAVTPRLYAAGERLTPGDPRVEDYAAVQMDLAGGTVVQLACSWRLPAGRDCVIEASFFGTDGGASMVNVEGSFYDFVAEGFRGVRRRSLAAPPDPWGGRALVQWTRRLAAGEGYAGEGAELVRVAQVLDAIYGLGDSEVGAW